MFAASYLPAFLVVFTCLVVPAVGMAFLFLYIEREDPTGI